MTDEIVFRNKKEELGALLENKEFFEGLQALAKKFHGKVKYYGRRFGVKLDIHVHYELIDPNTKDK